MKIFYFLLICLLNDYWFNWRLYSANYFLPNHLFISSVQSLSLVRLFVTPRIAARQASLSITISRSYSDSCPSSPWCHPAISSSVVPFSSCLQAFPVSGSFQMRMKSIGASALASVISMNIQGWFPLGLTGWISLQSKRLSRVFSSTTVGKHQFFSAYPSLWSNPHIHMWLLEKP